MASSRPTTKSRLPDNEIVAQILEQTQQLMVGADAKEREDIGLRCMHAIQGARWAYWFLRTRRLLPVAGVVLVLSGVLLTGPPPMAALGGCLMALALGYAVTVWIFLAQWHSCERHSKMFLSTNDILRYDPRHRRRLEEELKGLGERLLAP